MNNPTNSQNQQLNQKLSLYKYISYVLSAIGILALSLSYVFNFDEQIGYFQNSITLYAFYFATAIIVILSLSAIFVFSPKHNPAQAKIANNENSRVAILPIIGIILFVIFSLYFTIYNKEENFKISSLFITTILSAILSIIYFLLIASKTQVSINSRVLLGLFVIIWCAVSIFQSYFNNFIPINSTIKISFQFSSVFFMLFTTAQMRFFLGQPRSNMFIFSAIPTMFLSGTSGISFLISMMVGKTSNVGFFLPIAIANLFIFAYVLINFSISKFIYDPEQDSNDPTTQGE